MAVLRLLAVACLLAPANSLYFHLKERQVKCFIEEVPDETLVVGKYKTLRHNPDGSYAQEPMKGTGMHVMVKDPTDATLVAKDYEAAGRFSFNTQVPGEHTICLSSNTTSGWFGGELMRVHLDLRVGEQATDYDQVQKKEQLTQAETRIYQLISQVKQIANEQAYQRAREATFREISESTNVRVLWWSIGQAFILVMTGFLQLRHLKSFFEAKKLV
eukprot:m.334546 g.334546  ORF g.334546 m.334546 type:complete len:216 (-) comp17378_c0_seq1:52-699(-)